MTQHYVDPRRVFVASAHESDVKRMIKVLEKQGQIEPLMVKPARPGVDSVYHDFDVDAEENFWGPAIVIAARRLRWDTILVETENVTSG